MTDLRAERNFLAFEPLLWRVLGSLAKSGFVASPLDARDVIHDFYVEAWDGVGHRFDEEVSDFRTYLSSSFYKFARRRIVASRGWRHRLVDIDLIADDLVDTRTPQRIVEQRQLVAAIRVALLKVPAGERAVLYEYLQDSQPSERTIALRYKLSRHALRERLHNALGRVAVEMGRVDGDRVESLVAFHLWSEGRSPRNVSDLLGIPVPEVQRCKTEFAAQLLLTLRGSPRPQPKPQIGGTMNPLESLRTALLSPGDLSLLHKLKSASKLREQLLSDMEQLDFTEEESSVLDRNADWVAVVYAAIAGEVDEDADEQAMAAALIALRHDAEHEIGEAFVNLLERLEGSEFSDWKSYFGTLKSVSSEEQAFYLEAPSFVEGVPNAKLLASVGLTPLMFHDCARGMELLFDRLLDSPPKLEKPNVEAPFPDVELSDGRQSLYVPGGLVVSQFATTPGMNPLAVRGMAHWLGDILQRVPLLVRGYEANWQRGRLKVNQLALDEYRSSNIDDLVQRWTRVTANA